MAKTAQKSGRSKSGTATTRRRAETRTTRARNGAPAGDGRAGGGRSAAQRAKRSGGDSADGLLGAVTGPGGEWDLDAREDGFRTRQLYLFNLLSDHYFRIQTEGWHRLPDEAGLVVGIHAGGILPMDAWIFGFEWYRRFGTERELLGTAHDGLLSTPLLGHYMRKMGVLPAAPEPMLNALKAGHDVAVYPGGDRDALRPWTQRDKVELAGRTGFVKLAIKAGSPIVPVASVGAADTVIVLTEGRSLAKLLRLDKLLRAKVVPVAVGLPWGVAPALLPFIPLPAKLRYEVLEPVEVGDDPERADDKQYVKRLYDRVERRMQAGMDRLAQRRSFPLLG